MTENPGATITYVQKFTKEVDTFTGKTLSKTDIDFIVESAGETIYYQAKSSARAFGSPVTDAVVMAKAWVKMALKDAERSAVPNAIIRYVTPNLSSVHPKIIEALDELGVSIQDSPLLH